MHGEKSWTLANHKASGGGRVGFLLTLVVEPQWVRVSEIKSLKCHVVTSWAYTKGILYMAEGRFPSHRQVMKSLLIGNVYNLCRL
jgi:hypothetical protein